MSETIIVKEEIERRWLIDFAKIPDFIKAGINDESLTHIDIVQWYINRHLPTMRIRSEDDKRFIYCIKTSSDKKGIGKPESETLFNREEYNNTVKKAVAGPIVKTRFFVENLIKGPKFYYVIHLDIMKEEHKGLIFAEVEFPSEEEAENFIPLNWFGEEVTGKKEYSNSSLAKDLETSVCVSCDEVKMTHTLCMDCVKEMIAQNQPKKL